MIIKLYDPKTHRGWVKRKALVAGGGYETPWEEEIE